MRISTNGAYLRGLTAMQRLQFALDHTQQQISSGRRILKPSDDPVAAGQAIAMRESLARLEQFDRNAGILSNRLAHEETALVSVNNVLQRVRELALEANNPTQSNETRALIAVEVRQLLDQLVNVANEKDGNGHYLFSGNMEETQPIAKSGSAYSYQGDQGQRFIQIAEGRQIADGDTGDAIFFRIANGNGQFSSAAAAVNTGTGILGAGSVIDATQYDGDDYTVNFTGPGTYEVLDSSAAVVASGSFQPGDSIAFRGIELSIDGQPATGDEFFVSPSQSQDIFTTIDLLATSIENNVVDDVDRAAMTNGINAGLLNIDQALGNLLQIRTQVGTRLAAVESQVDTNGGLALGFQETLADLEDLDYAEALSRLSQQITTLEAAQQSFINTQSLSLFNYF